MDVALIAVLNVAVTGAATATPVLTFAGVTAVTVGAGTTAATVVNDHV
jgi:hypothetical protein